MACGATLVAGRAGLRAQLPVLDYDEAHENA